MALWPRETYPIVAQQIVQRLQTLGHILQFALDLSVCRRRGAALLLQLIEHRLHVDVLFGQRLLGARRFRCGLPVLRLLLLWLLLLLRCRLTVDVVVYGSIAAELLLLLRLRWEIGCLRLLRLELIRRHRLRLECAVGTAGRLQRLRLMRLRIVQTVRRRNAVRCRVAARRVRVARVVRLLLRRCGDRTALQLHDEDERAN